MDALRKKWHSRQGASILMALLFLVVCMMVGSSVLMAAVSNAGKLKSNQDEQQKYLTLSSALNLVCDELESVEYVGQYRYTRVLVDTWQAVGRDSEGKDIYDYMYDHDRHCYAQEEGLLRSTKVSGQEWDLKNVLPLFHNLDAIFAEKFVPPSPKWDPMDDYNSSDFVPLPNLDKASHTITLSLKDGDAYGGLKEEVTIKADVSDRARITLTATMGEYSMEAVLLPEQTLRDVLALDKTPENEKVPGQHQQVGLLPVNLKEGALNETKPLTWTLDYIAKKEAKKDEQAAG